MPNKLQKEIIALEKATLKPIVRRSEEAIGRLLTDDFYEIVASGQYFDKKAILKILPAQSPRRFLAQKFKVHVVASNAVLLTYFLRTIVEGKSTDSWRSSLWIREKRSWRMRYHQATSAES